ncbi:MAG: hypothetical protein GOP50_06895 [Candidatus Heimdallarchaeota archaeon]|nr:hypothetical protein [Candidatus Heimdallarchaeota archaeon]
MNNWKTYLAISIVGLTVGILYLIIQSDLATTLMIFFITLYTVAALKFLLERRHYKKHNSILASSQFLLLPYAVLLMGNYISPVALTVEIFTIRSSGGSELMFFNLISISLIVPVIILSIFFSKFYSGKWPGIAINRKINRGKKIPFLLHSFFILTFLIGFFINWQIDFVCFIFVILYLVYIFRYFVIVAFNKSRREVTVSARSSTRRTTSTGSSSATRRRGQVTASSRSGTRSVPTRSRSTSTTSRSTTRRATRSTTSSARVAPGIDVPSSKRKMVKTTKTTTTVTKSMFPIGTPKKEEMKCIICYMDFNKKESRKIILCPNCKYPAHEDEFLNWFQKSRLCARCNQPISTRYVNNPKYRVTVKIYIEKVIEKL